MFHKVTTLVYALFGGMVGHKVAQFAEKDTATALLFVVVGALITLGVYYVLRFLRFAESAYRRETVAAPQFFKAGDEKDAPPVFTRK